MTTGLHSSLFMGLHSRSPAFSHCCDPGPKGIKGQTAFLLAALFLARGKRRERRETQNTHKKVGVARRRRGNHNSCLFPRCAYKFAAFMFRASGPLFSFQRNFFFPPQTFFVGRGKRRFHSLCQKIPAVHTQTIPLTGFRNEDQPLATSFPRENGFNTDPPHLS